MEYAASSCCDMIISKYGIIILVSIPEVSK